MTNDQARKIRGAAMRPAHSSTAQQRSIS
jgi:hypothetical protein